MFHFQTTRNNAIGYLFWSWLMKKNGGFTARLDAFYFGSSRGLNDYDALASQYKGSNVKPDKQYSILPTVLAMLGNCAGKIAIDIGCGSGFFTIPLAQLGFEHVYGIDNSHRQIALAQRIAARSHITYAVADVFVDQLPKADVILVPFILNYARTVAILQHFLEKLYKQLSEGGKVAFVIDLPNGKSLQRFGAVKTVDGQLKDEASIQINLFNGSENICTLKAVYYTTETIERLLRIVGFTNLKWHTPIISNEGLMAMGSKFWDGYAADPELGYLSAQK